jgi:hypothetical protein
MVKLLVVQEEPSLATKRRVAAMRGLVDRDQNPADPKVSRAATIEQTERSLVAMRLVMAGYQTRSLFFSDRQTIEPAP